MLMIINKRNMKNIFKYSLVLSLVLVFVSCEKDDNNGLGKDNPRIGWVEFAGPGASTTISIITEVLEIPLEVNVPVYENGLNISYRLEAVEGDFNEIVTTSGTVFADPSDYSRRPTIKLNFSGVADIDEKIVFDVVLTAVDVSGVTLGVDDQSVIRYRISTPCPIDINGLVGTYSVVENFTSGVNAPFGLTDFFSESYQLELSIDPNDLTQTKLIINNSLGFDTYINNGTVITFDTCSGTVSYSSSPLQLALFSTLAISASSYTESPYVITSSGAFGGFGPYQFTLTKQ